MKKLFKVTIEDENGNIVNQIESDCIMAAISNPKKDTITGVFVTSCDTNTIANALATLNGLKKQVYKSNPLLMFAEMLDNKGENGSENMEKEVSDIFSKLRNL